MNPAYYLYKETIKKFLFKNNLDKNLKILDLGCGDFQLNPILNSHINFSEFVGIDAYNFKNNNGYSANAKFVNKLIFEIEDLYPKKYFDIVFALDLIEHLDENQGMSLIKLMKKMSKKAIVIFTPNGFIPQYDPKNKFNCHRSGWSYEFFKKNNFEITGIYGPKIFRGEFCELKKPKLLNGILSIISNICFTRYFPKYDMSLFCSKFH